MSFISRISAHLVARRLKNYAVITKEKIKVRAFKTSTRTELPKNCHLEEKKLKMQS